MENIGDRVQAGPYRVQATFRRSILLFQHHQPLFLVTPSIGPGPLNVVYRKLPRKLEALQIEKDHSFPVFSSKMPTPAWVKTSFWVSRLAQTLKEHARDGVAMWMLHPPPVSPNASFIYFQHALNLLKSPPTWCDGIRQMRGFGPGLTPSGDDFLSGFFLALRLRKITSVLPELLPHALGANLISNAFLTLAAKGRVHLALQEFINTSPSSPEFSKKLLQVCTFGHTSGSDLLAGLLFGSQFHL